MQHVWFPELRTQQTLPTVWKRAQRPYETNMAQRREGSTWRQSSAQQATKADGAVVSNQLDKQHKNGNGAVPFRTI